MNLVALSFATVLFATGCSSTSATSTECAALSKRCALCPGGSLKSECEATAKGADTAACKTKLNDNQDIRNNCVEPTVSDAGTDPITEPCVVLQSKCIKCKTPEKKDQCQAAIRDSEPGACRALLMDTAFTDDCK
jgi:hypothetical protein